MALRVGERVLCREEEVVSLGSDHLVLPVWELRSHWVRMGRLALHLDRYRHGGRLTEAVLARRDELRRPGDCFAWSEGEEELLLLFLGPRGELGHRHLGRAFRSLGRLLRDRSGSVAVETPAGGWSDVLPLIPAYVRAAEALAQGLDGEDGPPGPASIDFLVAEGDAPLLAGLAAAPWGGGVLDGLSAGVGEGEGRRISSTSDGPTRRGDDVGRELLRRGPFAVVHGPSAPRDALPWCLVPRGGGSALEEILPLPLVRALHDGPRGDEGRSRWLGTGDEAELLVTALPPLASLDNAELGRVCRAAASSLHGDGASRLLLSVPRGAGDVHAIVRGLREGLEEAGQGAVPDLAFWAENEDGARELAFAVANLPRPLVESWEALRRRRLADGEAGRRRLAHLLDYEMPTPLARLWRRCRRDGRAGREALLRGVLAFHRAVLLAEEGRGGTELVPRRRLAEELELVDGLVARGGDAPSVFRQDLLPLWTARGGAGWRQRLEAAILRCVGLPVEGEEEGETEDLMGPLAHLASYSLLHVVDGMDAGTAWMHTVERLRGWGATAEKEEFVVARPLDGGSCVLVDPGQRELLALDPWLCWETCPACGTNHVFVVDGLEGDEVLHRALDGEEDCRSRRSLAVWERALSRRGRGWEALGGGESELFAPVESRDWFLPVGAVLDGRFEVVGALKRGGMAEVYRAFDRELAVDVALKLMAPDLMDSRSAESRFRREAALLSRIRHENVVAVTAFGRVGGRSYLAMDFVDGEDLRENMAMRGPWSPGEVAALGTRLLAALVHLHEVPGGPVVHRDLKPENVLVAADGTVKLGDFGLARAPEHTRLTGSGVALGTLRYMAPEQSRGEVDPRSDLYSLGVVLFELLAGRLPMPVEDGRRSLEAEGASPALAAFVVELLSPDPDDRPPTARSALARLDALAGSAPDGTSGLRPVPTIPSAETLQRLVAALGEAPLFEGLERFYHSGLKPRALYLLDALESGLDGEMSSEEGARCAFYLDEIAAQLRDLVALPGVDGAEAQALLSPARRLVERIGTGRGPGCREALRRLVDLTEMALGAFRAVTRSFRLSAVLRDGAALHAPATERGQLRILFDLPEEEPRPSFLAPGLRRALVDAIHELLENARKAMAERDERDCVLRLMRDAGTGAVRIEVVDSGPGISPAMAESLFRPGESAFGSSGLGLAGLRGDLARFGVTLRVGPGGGGRGARFIVDLPRHVLEGEGP